LRFCSHVDTILIHTITIRASEQSGYLHPLLSLQLQQTKMLPTMQFEIVITPPSRGGCSSQQRKLFHCCSIVYSDAELSRISKLIVYDGGHILGLRFIA